MPQEFNVQNSFVAWTGGSIPGDLDKVSEQERALVYAMLEMQVAAFTAFWGRTPEPATRLLYLNRARYDAHATVREGQNVAGILGG